MNKNKTFRFQHSSISGVIYILPQAHADCRGGFKEVYSKSVSRDAGIKDVFVQDNVSISHKGILRGMHVQIEYPQSKIVYSIRGSIFDVVVDLRLHSPTFGRYDSRVLSGENGWQVYVPQGCAHGFLSLEDNTFVSFKVSDNYRGHGELGISWCDQMLDIAWPDLGYEPILNKRDAGFRGLSDRDNLQILKKARFNA